MLRRVCAASTAIFSVLALSALIASGQQNIDWPKHQNAAVATASDGGIDWP
ncbi:hypothetical protein OG223_25975 [Streptomyces sp. NBC_01478]|uniref:hypothetical protein n=1 Tax=Streptomyces sp. NBC_01478 TaxID=2903882 RepID=UPI002E320A7B|nr:hypothetical protein [Streptomyces sp. NBC_01478]